MLLLRGPSNAEGVVVLLGIDLLRLWFHGSGVLAVIEEVSRGEGLFFEGLIGRSSIETQMVVSKTLVAYRFLYN